MTETGNSTRLLDELIALFTEEIEEADFLRAWRGHAEARRLTRPTVTGEVDGETVKPGSEETRLKFKIFLPEGVGADKAEDLFAAMCTLAGRHYPGFSAISRGAADRDKNTGALAVSCTLSFLTRTEGGGSAPSGCTVTLGGREFSVTGVKTTVTHKGDELISVGESVPFAVLGEAAEYTVELEGLDVSGLENMTGFTAVVGNAATYVGCRWKSLSDVLRKAVFVSRKKQPLQA